MTPIEEFQERLRDLINETTAIPIKQVYDALMEEVEALRGDLMRHEREEQQRIFGQRD